MLKLALLLCLFGLSQSKMCEKNLSVAYFKGFCPGGAKPDSGDWHWYNTREWESYLETKWTTTIDERISANAANQESSTSTSIDQKVKPMENRIAHLMRQYHAEIDLFRAELNQALADVIYVRHTLTETENTHVRTQTAIDEWYNERQAQIAKDLSKKRNTHSTVPVDSTPPVDSVLVPMLLLYRDILSTRTLVDIHNQDK